MSVALIGHTGFVGSNLKRHREFDHVYNTSNIEELASTPVEKAVCAAAPAAKWYANAHPEEDRRNLHGLMQVLEASEIRHLILISTVDVYTDPVGVDEETVIDPDRNHPYGRHRYELEEFVRSNFPSHTIVRLPALFGDGLKKNFIFDLMTGENLDWTDHASVYQFYNLENLADDLDRIQNAGLALVNVTSAPLRADRIAQDCFGRDFTNRTDRGPVRYDMRTLHPDVLGGVGSTYHYGADEILADLRAFGRHGRVEF